MTFGTLQNYFSYNHVIKAIIYYYKMFLQCYSRQQKDVYPH